MKILVFIIVFLLTVPSFAANKKKKKTPPAKKEPEIVLDDSCYSNAIDWQQLLTTNPYDTEGKCYWISFPLMKQQLLSRHTALVGFASPEQNIFALMIFPKESVPMGPIHGLVLGAGAYEYETVGGGMNTVHKLIKMEKYLIDTRKPKPTPKEEPVKEQPSESDNSKGESK